MIDTDGSTEPLTPAQGTHNSRQGERLYEKACSVLFSGTDRQLRELERDTLLMLCSRTLSQEDEVDFRLLNKRQLLRLLFDHVSI